MRRLAIGAALVVSATACTLLTDLDGLSGPDAPSFSDAGDSDLSERDVAAPDARTDADVGAPCTAATCVPVLLASGQDRPSEIVVGGGFVYWRNAGVAQVSRMPSGGGGLPSTFVMSANGTGLALDGTALYSIHFCSLSATPLDGAPVRSSPSLCGLHLLSLGDDSVYSSIGSRVVKLSNVVADAGLTTLSDRGGGTIRAVVASGGQVFSTYSPTMGAGEVAFVPTSGGLSSTLAPGQVEPSGLAVDSVGVAWVTAGAADAGVSGAVMVRRLSVDTPHVVSKPGAQPAPGAVAIDPEYVYFAGAAAATDPAIGAPYTLYRARRDGSAAADVLVEGEPAVESIAVDATSIYWTSRSQFEDGGAVAASGMVKKLAKP